MDHPSFHASAQASSDPAPSLLDTSKTKIVVAKTAPSSATCIGLAIGTDGELPRELGLDREALAAAGFEGKLGDVQVVPQAKGPLLVVFGIGKRGELDVSKLRDAAALCARAAGTHEKIALAVPDLKHLSPELVAQALVEGAVLARYQYLLKATAKGPTPLRELTLVSEKAGEELKRGSELGSVTARATQLARDLAEAPATLLSARRMAEIAEALATECGLDVEVFDEKALLEMGCGGLLGVNAGSVEPPRMIKLTYRPKGQATGNVSVVAKGIMFDSGGLGLKPNDLVHATMKGDMSGAAAVLAAMTTLRALDCKNVVTAYLMCTDNMPSGTAMKLGDVLTVRGGKTVEVINTDAEGRLVMADALVLSTEQNPRPDAIIDIATLTGACQRALGLLTAGVLGNHQPLVDQVIASGQRTDEQVWQLPLEKRYRKELDSNLADLKNVGGENAGAITAGLFLEEFVDGIPWAHIDIAGTARLDSAETWRPPGATGFGARLLVDFLMAFTPPAQVH
ncbi:MAG: leucyl aminopeptidase [Kofleriaceae bacterium]|nr:leucyl aminopeptidase [Kofleriaceae bacterium]